mmetsp:Transcript_4145/g.9665  ORF Transcript_4145/g.9665 Transcript_4145/m.9665 type:complete len:214 (-) Transcript_4145:91-732(-)
MMKDVASLCVVDCGAAQCVFFVYRDLPDGVFQLWALHGQRGEHQVNQAPRRIAGAFVRVEVTFVQQSHALNTVVQKPSLSQEQPSTLCSRHRHLAQLRHVERKLGICLKRRFINDTVKPANYRKQQLTLQYRDKSSLNPCRTLGQGTLEHCRPFHLENKSFNYAVDKQLQNQRSHRPIQTFNHRGGNLRSCLGCPRTSTPPCEFAHHHYASIV